MNKQLITEELERIRLQDPERKLKPEAVVDAVNGDLDHPLREYFTWDAEEALGKVQLIEARQLIRVAVTVIPSTQEPVRAYCSLTTDRHGRNADGSQGGYRSMVEVMSDEHLRAILLQDALRELHTFRHKYSKLTELSALFEVADTLNEPDPPAAVRRRRAAKKKTKKKTKKPARKKKRKGKDNDGRPRRAGRRPRDRT